MNALAYKWSPAMCELVSGIIQLARARSGIFTRRESRVEPFATRLSAFFFPPLITAAGVLFSLMVSSGSTSDAHQDRWDASSFLIPGNIGQYAVILLNQAVPASQRELFVRIWQGASIRLCADGGSNRLLELESEVPDTILKHPHAIVGDLDSITASTREIFSSRGVTIAHKPSQYATDLQKCIQWIEDSERKNGSQLELVIFGGLSGRLDQTAHTLHVLWKLSPSLPSQGGYEDPDPVDEQVEQRGGNLTKRNRTWVVGEGSLAFLLPAGRHTLRLPNRPLGKCCGILPFGVPGGTDSNNSAAKVRTEGLEWDLDPAQPQSIGGYLSTSNHVMYPAAELSTSIPTFGLRGDDSPATITTAIAEVVVETDKPIYWSVEI
ncbi:unnamed protein product [Sympodiomycopsis kandeliae]